MQYCLSQFTSLVKQKRRSLFDTPFAQKRTDTSRIVWETRLASCTVQISRETEMKKLVFPCSLRKQWCVCVLTLSVCVCLAVCVCVFWVFCVRVVWRAAWVSCAVCTVYVCVVCGVFPCGCCWCLCVRSEISRGPKDAKLTVVMACLFFEEFCVSHHKKVRRYFRAKTFAPQVCSSWPIWSPG